MLSKKGALGRNMGGFCLLENQLRRSIEVCCIQSSMDVHLLDVAETTVAIKILQVQHEVNCPWDEDACEADAT